MPFAFLAPLALAAAALIVVPWYLHHIRRPEHKPVVFSSLMFVPDTRKEIVQRRRLQHVALMLLRMLILILLAYAFARPFIPVDAALPEVESGLHVILLDTSCSVQADDRFAAVKEAARRVARGIDSQSETAVIAFNAAPRLLSGFAGRAETLSAIDQAAPSWDRTDYAAAMRVAADLLLQRNGGQAGLRRVVHLISDFQQSGMPEPGLAWRLPAQIEFDPVVVKEPDNAFSIIDAFLQEKLDKRVQLRAKVKNWTSAPRAIDVRLIIDGKVHESKSIETAPGNASLVTFDLVPDGEHALRGWLETDGDAYAVDNRRYFAWNASGKQPIGILGATDAAKRWSGRTMLQFALADSIDSPWRARDLTSLDADALAEIEAVVVSDTIALTDETAAGLAEYVSQGGQALVFLGGRPPNRILLSAFGLRIDEPALARDTNPFVNLSWVDFEHPVFKSFAGPRHNDFSNIRFSDFHLLGLESEAAETRWRILARFDSQHDTPAGAPAVIEIAHGQGRALVWAMSLDYEWTNLARTARFVPLLHESLAYLAGGPLETRMWTIGDEPASPRPGYSPAFASADGEATALTSERLESAGFVHWQPGASGMPERLEPVNVDMRESDPATITPAEFALRLCAAPLPAELQETPANTGLAGSASPRTAWEYGRYVLALVLAAMLLEIGYAGYLAKSRDVTDAALEARAE